MQIKILVLCIVFSLITGCSTKNIFEEAKITDVATEKKELESEQTNEVEEGIEQALESDNRILKINNSFIIPASSSILLSESDLRDFIAFELKLARNEIFARHGYVFDNNILRNYFGSQIWYEENASFDTSDLSDIELNNIQCIKNKEQVLRDSYISNPDGSIRIENGLMMGEAISKDWLDELEWLMRVEAYKLPTNLGKYQSDELDIQKLREFIESTFSIKEEIEISKNIKLDINLDGNLEQVIEVCVYPENPQIAQEDYHYDIEEVSDVTSMNMIFLIDEDGIELLDGNTFLDISDLNGNGKYEMITMDQQYTISSWWIFEWNAKEYETVVSVEVSP